MAKADMSLVGLQGTHRVRVAASATRGYAGEPLITTGTFTSGVASVNTVVVATDGTGVIGTDVVVGLLGTDMVVNSSGTVTAQKVMAGIPIPFVTRWRGRHKTAASADTDSEVLGLLFDIAIFDLTSSTYTWDVGTADTGAFQVRDGNPAKSTLDCVIDARGMRVDIS